MKGRLDANAHNERGIQLADKGWHEQAIAEFRKAIDLEPAFAPARDNLATLLADQGDLLGALEQYIMAVRAEPDYAPAYNYLGAFLAQFGPDLMLGAYRRCLELDAYSVEALYNLGIALLDMGRVAEAFEPLNRALQLEPDNVQIMLEIGVALVEEGRYTEAVKQLRAVIKRDPTQIDAWTYLGRAFAGKGLFSEAERFLLKAHDDNPESVAIVYELGRIYNQWQGKQPELRRWLAEALRLDRDELLQQVRRDPHGAPMLHAAGLSDLLESTELSGSDVKPIP